MFPTQIIRQRLATGLALSAVAVGLFLGLAAGETPSAQAAPRRPVDNGVRCAVQTGPGQWELFLPGETIVVVDANGRYHYYMCASNGDWIVSGPTAITTPTRHLASALSNTLSISR